MMHLTTPQLQTIAHAAFLVTGGAGFIGSHIAELLLNAGARKVRILDNLSTGHFRNVAPFANHPRLEFINGDIRDVSTCKAVCREMDYVFHQASMGFLNILVSAQLAGVQRVVYADNDELYMTEEGYGMEAVGLRYFNVFGQRQHLNSRYAAVIPACIMRLIKHESPVIKASEEYAQDFNFVENVVQANMLALFNTDARALNQVYDITSEKRPSLYEMANHLKELLCAFDESIAGVDIMYEHGPVNNAGPLAAVEKARDLLGYRPRYTMREGLLQSVSWYWTFLPQFELEEKGRKHRLHHSDTFII